MNFLSHYYFDKAKTNPLEIVGMLLPDLTRNADKSWNLHPEKLPAPVFGSKSQQAIMLGWQRHLKVDRVFHSSMFFRYHQHQLKLCIRESLNGTPIKPFFVGHIGIELLLDSLLITQNKVNVNDFYRHLAKVDLDEIRRFLKLNHIHDVEKFCSYYQRFLAEKYIYTYADVNQISHAIKNICKRIWPFTLSAQQEEAITLGLQDYKKTLSESFMVIFDEIDAQINR
ncbi:ACP phosphodiesterase [Pelobium manganitolerans]|uniref:ACP phosphodiesterase n=1 Tax=Pelobium manganitolerans TaxID=1842495 RepID=UPI003FA35EDC